MEIHKEKLKSNLKTLFFPHIILLNLLIILSVAGLTYAFGVNGTNMIIVYGSYFLSAYTLTAICVRIPRMCKWITDLRNENKYISIYREHIGMRVKFSLYVTLFANVIYALIQLIMGMINHAFWFYSLAGYYILLAIMRYFLLKEMRKENFGTDRWTELLIFRFCGVMLLLMNIAIAIVFFLMIRENRGFEHYYIITIAMAVYTFVVLTIAIMNLFSYRKYNSPVMVASKVISFVAALVSVISLETSMFASFGADTDPVFKNNVIRISGFCVCVIVHLLALIMIFKSTKEIIKMKKLKND